MEFEWDENKNYRNILKHKINFVLAEKFFAGEIFERIDNRKNYGEKRFVALGELEQRIFIVVYTRPKVNIYRIISMRRARKDEQRTYYSLQKGHEGYD